MQLIRAEIFIIKRVFSQIHHIFPRRHFHSCIIYNQKWFRFNKHFTHKISRYKIPGSTRSITNNISAYIDGEEQDIEKILGHSNVRLCLHQDSEDPLTQRINKCASVDQVFSILNEELNNVKSEHASQLVVVLWDLHRIYKESYLQNLVKEDVESSPEYMLNTYLDQLQNHGDFKKILQILDANHTSLTLSEASCCLLYLKMMGIPLTEPVMEHLMQICQIALDRSEEGKPALGLVDLTRITAALEPKLNFFYLPFSRQILPIVLQYLDECKSPEELRLLTYILSNIQLVVVEQILNRYKLILKRLLSTGALGRRQYPILLQVANFLSFPGWSNHNFKEIREICEIVAPEIKSMDAVSVSDIHKVFQGLLEPSYILEEINKRSGELISVMLHDERLGTCLLLPHLLYSYVTYSPPEKRKDFEKTLSQCVSKLFPSTLSPFYRTLRHLKTPNEYLCNKFWGNSVYKMIDDSDDDYLLIMFSHKYLYFSNVGQIYRNVNLERLLTEKLMKKFDEGYATLFPKKLAKMCSFLLAFGIAGNSLSLNEMDRVVSHVESAKQQFDPIDCLVMSRGLQICSILTANKRAKRELSQLLHRVDVVITDQTQHLSGKSDLSIQDLKCLVKCHILKKSHPNVDVISDLVKMYAKISNRSEQLNSIVIRDTSYNLSLCKVVVPSLFEEMAGYLADSKERVLGETAHKVLSLFYNLGYEVKTRGMFDASSVVLERDKHAMSALSLLQSCCALTYYNQLPDSLVKYIFSIKFMERLDAEVATCYQQWVYPRRVRWQLMHLNRCVCIEYPQHRVPWFHHKYLQEQISNSQIKNTHLERNVLETLKSVWPQSLIKAPHYSPYGYKMNFYVTLDENDSVGTPYSREIKKKVAIILLDNNDFCKVLEEEDRSEPQLKTVANGYTKHRQRHLEMLGYKVVEISSSLWYSMHMAEDNLKEDYLKEKILDNNSKLIE